MLGNEPIPEKIVLSLGADFVQKFRADPGEVIPTGSTVHIRFYPPGQTDTLVFTHEAACNVYDTYAEARIESTIADTIPRKAHWRVYISYPDTPSLEHCWYVGDVVRKQ